jgi:hypothetical protein
MSTRALRKLQREQEEQKQLAQLTRDEQEVSEESEEDAPIAPKSKQRSAFELLNEGNDDEDSEEQDERAPEEESNQPESVQSETEDVSKPKSHQKNKRKSKKKRKGGKAKEVAASTDNTHADVLDAPLDEIDLALRALKTTTDASQDGKEAAIQEDLKHFYTLLATDSRHLNALNEMKKLFGSSVLEGENAEGAGAARRRGRGQQAMDLGAALAGRNNPVSRGQGLTGLALRKNILIPGNEEWPKAGSGGLGMELVEKAWDFTTEYRFVHSSVYQRVQKEFDVCVNSMDPQRMIQQLHYNPYHISTLLQVSEIAKQQGDHSVAADLQERALFTFGRSGHSTFGHALSEGKARLDFRRPEDREFWLAAWRYVVSLGQRGTWRTAYEWARLILSLDPEGDPYSIRMVIDQLAIRGGQFEHFIKFAETDPSVVDWGQNLPNIQISLAMAHFRLKHTQECRALLTKCVQRYPWIFASLLKELDVDRVPPSVWGQLPRTTLEELHAQSYVTRAKDIWGTPEAVSFLVEVVETTKADKDAIAPNTSDDVSRNEARHILLSEVPSLIALLPRTYTTERTSSSDPLPPEDSESYSGAPVELDADDAFEAEFPSRNRGQGQQGPGRGQDVMGWFRSIFSSLGVGQRGTDPEGSNGGNASTMEAEEILQIVAQQQGVPVQELQRQFLDGERQRQLEDALSQQEGEMVARAMEASMQGMQQSDEPEASSASNASGRPNQPTVEDEQSEPETESEPPMPPPNDEDANKRWLAGRGMLALKDFVAKHGTDETKWKDDLDVDSRPATEYAFRVTKLNGKVGRDFILNYSLPQGAGKETGAMIKRMIA